MKIYTKSGDRGETSLFGGDRVSKDHLRIETYGTVDELNSLIGVCRAAAPPPEVERILEILQHDLFTLGADLATPKRDEHANAAVARIRRINRSNIERLEHAIDTIDPLLAPLKFFILPGGTQCAALLHFARTVCRRAERLTVRLSHGEEIGEEPVIYLNRLSDLLFVLARWANTLARKEETPWRSEEP